MSTPAGIQRFSLLFGDTLVVEVSDALLPLATAWLPLHAERVALTPARVEAVIEVVHAESTSHEREMTSVAPLLLFSGVRARKSSDGTIALHGTSTATGRISLETRRAQIAIPDSARDRANAAHVAGDLYSMLTLSAAFLIGRLGSSLVHAAAVVDPSGRAWLLAGDTHAGKTTTCVSLADAGWSFLADDQVVLRDDGDGRIVAEGWPRHAHLDEGWSSATVTGTRATLDLRTQWGARWLRRAPLGGVFFPRVAADAPTAVAPVHAATAFASIVRQSPWLMADRGAAPAVLDVLRRTANRPAFALTLGRDSYARGALLAARLAPALGAADALWSQRAYR